MKILPDQIKGYLFSLLTTKINFVCSYNLIDQLFRCEDFPSQLIKNISAVLALNATALQASSEQITGVSQTILFNTIYKDLQDFLEKPFIKNINPKQKSKIRSL